MHGCHSFGTQLKRIENAAETQEKPLNEEVCPVARPSDRNKKLQPQAPAAGNSRGKPTGREKKQR
jgi:hypothetical protein